MKSLHAVAAFAIYVVGGVMSGLLLSLYFLLGGLVLEFVLQWSLRIPFFESPIDAVYVMVGLAILFAMCCYMIDAKRRRDEEA